MNSKVYNVFIPPYFSGHLNSYKFTSICKLSLFTVFFLGQNWDNYNMNFHQGAGNSTFLKITCQGALLALSDSLCQPLQAKIWSITIQCKLSPIRSSNSTFFKYNLGYFSTVIYWPCMIPFVIQNGRRTVATSINKYYRDFYSFCNDTYYSILVAQINSIFKHNKVYKSMCLFAVALH